MQMQAPQQTYRQPVAQPRKGRGCMTCLVISLVVLVILMFMCSCCSFFALSLAGAKGQPATIIKPTAPVAGENNGAAVPIPTGLTASATDSEINLAWNTSSASWVKKTSVYRSEKPDKGYEKLTTVDKAVMTYADKDAKKGTTYYYVVTAVSDANAESGNSTRAFAAIDVPALVPAGIYSWADVQKKAKADDKYLKVLTKVTGLTMTDVDRLVAKEKTGSPLKTNLTKGGIITNTMEDYRIVPNFILTYDRQALMDENGVPHVLVKCGNPMKRQVPVTATGVIIQNIQIFVTTIINIMPPPINVTIINAAQTANTIIVAITPSGVLINMGPSFTPPPSTIYVDPATFGDDAFDPNIQQDIDKALDEGQKWIKEGKLLISANPPDPAPSETVTMIIKVLPADPGVEVTYSVSGTDGYSNSGTGVTDANGEISFTIPGGGAEVHDTVSVSVPSRNESGTVEYTF